MRRLALLALLLAGCTGTPEPAPMGLAEELARQAEAAVRPG